MTPLPPRWHHRDWRFWVLTSGGLGMAPVAPGTFGTLGGVAIAVLLPPTALGFWLGLVAILLTGGLCVALGSWAEQAWGRKDPGCFVLDEVLGYLIAVVPFLDHGLRAWIAAFVVFRIFDVLKPPPIHRLERLRAGWGVMADDALAGVYSVIVLAIVEWLGWL